MEFEYEDNALIALAKMAQEKGVSLNSLITEMIIAFCDSKEMQEEMRKEIEKENELKK